MAQESIPLPTDIAEIVSRALEEDVGSGDLTAALIDEAATVTAEVSVREKAVLCGCAWFVETYRQLDERVAIDWRCVDGAALARGQLICEVQGPVRSVLTGERTALNFLQLLSGTATVTREYVTAVASTNARIFDTRKTIPGLRGAQKYAVRCGGGSNHRMGLYDAILIKENHIAAAGGIVEAVASARAQSPNVVIQIEVESLEQLQIALQSTADCVLLDNLPSESLRAAVQARDAHDGPRVDLEASGGVTLRSLRTVAETGVDRISIGALTKDVTAIDFSMRVAPAP